MTMQTCSLTFARNRGSAVRHRASRSEGAAPARRSAARRRCSTALSGVFDNAGIARRHIVAPLDWYMAAHGWHDRNAVYLEAAEQLFVDAATAAIEKAGLKPDADRRRRHGLDHRHRNPEPRSARRAAHRLSRRRPAGAGVRPRLRRRRQRPFARRAPCGRGSREPSGCSSPSRPARSRSASTATIRRRSSRPRCSATAPRRRSSPAASTASRRSRARPRSCGPTRCGSWAGTSRIPGLVGGVRPRDPAVHRGRARRRHRRHVRAAGHRPRRRSTASAATRAA